MIETQRQALTQSFVSRGLGAIERTADVVHDLAQVGLDAGIEARSPTQLVMERVQQLAQTLFGHILAAALVALIKYPRRGARRASAAPAAHHRRPAARVRILA